jgi:hypothetical protein
MPGLSSAKRGKREPNSAGVSSFARQRRPTFRKAFVGATVASEMSVKTENSGVKIRADAFVFARQIPGELRLRRTRKVRKQRAKDSIPHRRLHDRPALALKVTRSSSSCANVSVIPPSMPSTARSRASFEG